TVTATMTEKVTYRRTKSGQWVAYGPAHIVKAGSTVVVTKRDGSTKTETIEKVGKTFRVNGREMVYGYLARSTSSDRHPCAGCGRMIPARYAECRACEDDMLAEDM